MGHYGQPPVPLGELDLEWDEFMHYLYLPVRIPSSDPQVDSSVTGLPVRLDFLTPAITAAQSDARFVADHLDDPYVYVTARRGYATPDNPLNRPGWHTDDFGGTDLNYIWCDSFPTRALVSEAPILLASDDQRSMREMEAWAARAQAGHTPKLSIQTGEPGVMYRLDPYVIHTTPDVPAPGGMRSFFKISVSTHRYDLEGNSHNHLLPYNWPMYSRQELRNQPGAQANRDYSGAPG